MDNRKDWQAAVKIEDIPDAIRDIALVIGIPATIRLTEALGGQSVYMPKVDAIRRSIRNRCIRDEYTGYNRRELAMKYDLTEQQIRSIVGK